jgi:hypothetical protein
MHKLVSRKKQTVKELKTCIRLSRKLARQINRKLESLAQLNKMKASLKEQLVKYVGLNSHE